MPAFSPEMLVLLYLLVYVVGVACVTGAIITRESSTKTFVGFGAAGIIALTIVVVTPGFDGNFVVILMQGVAALFWLGIATLLVVETWQTMLIARERAARRG